MLLASLPQLSSLPPSTPAPPTLSSRSRTIGVSSPHVSPASPAAELTLAGLAGQPSFPASPAVESQLVEFLSHDAMRSTPRPPAGLSARSPALASPDSTPSSTSLAHEHSPRLDFPSMPSPSSSCPVSPLHPLTRPPSVVVNHHPMVTRLKYGVFKTKRIMNLKTDVVEFEPTNFEQASKDSCWRQAMLDEYKALINNDTWELL